MEIVVESAILAAWPSDPPSSLLRVVSVISVHLQQSNKNATANLRQAKIKANSPKWIKVINSTFSNSIQNHIQ